MTDAQRLKDCIAERNKVNKDLDDKLKEAVEKNRQTQQAKAEQSTRQS